MVELNHRQRTIKVKVVYYGPAVGGKTTNLQVLHHSADAQRRGELVSVQSAQDRTILFDLLPLKAAGFRGFDLRLQLAAVPGQAMYAATRKLVLKNADSVVFVANSAADRWDENVQSFREMAENLIAQQLDPSAMPLVLQYNKRDLPDVTPLDFMERALNARRVRSIPAVAVRGEGVLETFGAVLAATMEDLAVRYQVVDLGRGQPLQKWVRQALIDMFGTVTLAPSESPPVSTEDRRSVRVELPEDAVRLAARGPSARANETLVESYADVASRLGNELAEMREQKERLRHGFEQVQSMLSWTRALASGQPREAALRGALDPLLQAGGSRFASLVLPDEAGRPQLAATYGLTDDPLSTTSGGRRYLELVLASAEPKVHQAADSLDLGEALHTAELTSLVSVPMHTASGRASVVLLYYGPDDVLPGPPELSQLATLAALLGPTLESAGPAPPVQAGDTELELVGRAALEGLEDMLAAMLRLRDGLGRLRGSRVLPEAALRSLGDLSPGLIEALAVGRSLLALGGRRPLELEPVDLADVAAALGVPVGVGLAADVSADPALLKMALQGLLGRLRASGEGGVEMHVFEEGGFVRLELAGPAEEPARTAPPEPGGEDLQLARRLFERLGGMVREEPGDGRRRFVVLLRRA